MRLTIAALSLGLGLAAASAAQAGPFTITWVSDTPTFGVVSFTHGAVPADVTHNLGTITSPNGFWEITNLTIVELDGVQAGIGSDGLGIGGDFQHIAAPHAGDAGQGAVFHFNLAINAAAAAGAPPTVSTNASANLAHPAIGHVDEFFATVNGGTDAAKQNFISYGLLVSGLHRDPAIPEPASLLLLTGAIAGLGVLRRRRGGRDRGAAR